MPQELAAALKERRRKGGRAGHEQTYAGEIGGVRLEDLLLLTDDGCETLTDYPYDLEP